MAALCSNVAIKAGGNDGPDIIYVHRGGKYWIFDTKEEPKKPFGKLVGGEYPARDKWPYIHVAGGQSYYIDSMIMVYRHKWSLWQPKFKVGEDESNQLWDQPILDREAEDLGDIENAGALINVDVKGSRFAKIRGSEVCNLQVTGNMSVWINKCHPVDEDNERFPPNIWAAIRTRDKAWYYIDANGKYCKRTEFVRSKVWVDPFVEKINFTDISYTFSARNGRIIRICLDVKAIT